MKVIVGVNVGSISRELIFAVGASVGLKLTVADWPLPEGGIILNLSAKDSIDLGLAVPGGLGLHPKAAVVEGITLHTTTGGNPPDKSAKKRLAFWLAKVDIKLVGVVSSSVFAIALKNWLAKFFKFSRNTSAVELLLFIVAV